MNPSGPDSSWLEHLAAHADRELDPTARAQVEHWLATHPEAQDEFQTQRELSPNHTDLWERTRPAMPTEESWAGVLQGIHEGLLPAPTTPTPSHAGGWRQRAGWLLGSLTVAAAIAMVIWAASGSTAPPELSPNPEAARDLASTPVAPPEDPLAGFAVLPSATESDVEIQRVAGWSGDFVSIGAAPLTGSLVLAGQGDVALEGADPHPAWPGGEPVIVTAPGDAPMIFATKPR